MKEGAQIRTACPGLGTVLTTHRVREPLCFAVDVNRPGGGCAPSALLAGRRPLPMMTVQSRLCAAWVGRTGVPPLPRIRSRRYRRPLDSVSMHQYVANTVRSGKTASDGSPQLKSMRPFASEIFPERVAASARKIFSLVSISKSVVVGRTITGPSRRANREARGRPEGTAGHLAPHRRTQGDGTERPMATRHDAARHG